FISKSFRDWRQVVVCIIHKEVFRQVPITLRGVFISAEHAAALRRKSTLTIITMTARRDGADHDPIAFLTTSDVCANFVDNADALMAEHTAFGNRNDAPDGMDIRGANKRTC